MTLTLVGGLSSWGLSPFSALLAPGDVLGFLRQVTRPKTPP